MARKSKQLEREFFESERNFRLLVQGITDYAICMLDLGGNITNWNRGAERIKGYKAREIVGKHFSIFYPPEDREAGLPARVLEIARREKHFLAEGWRVRKDGTRFFASVVIDPIYEKRKLVGYAKITRDITERQQALADLHASDSQFKMLVSGLQDACKANDLSRDGITNAFRKISKFDTGLGTSYDFTNPKKAPSNSTYILQPSKTTVGGLKEIQSATTATALAEYLASKK